MAVFDTSQAAQWIPEKWAAKCLLARERDLIMGKRVLRYDSDLKGGGDTVNIPKIENLTTAAVGSGGSYSGQANTNTAYQIVVSTWREASVSIPDQIKVQSAYPLEDLYGGKIGFALGSYFETQLMGLYSGLANQLGSAGVAVTDDVLLNAVQILDEGDAPDKDRTAIFRPASKRTFMNIDKYFDASKTGLGKGAQITGLFGEFYGIPAFFSNNIVSSSGIHNLVFQKEAFGAAVQIDVKVEKFRTQLADNVVGHMLFGVLELRDDSTMGVSAVDILT